MTIVRISDDLKLENTIVSVKGVESTRKEICKGSGSRQLRYDVWRVYGPTISTGWFIFKSYIIHALAEVHMHPTDKEIWCYGRQHIPLCQKLAEALRDYGDFQVVLVTEDEHKWTPAMRD